MEQKSNYNFPLEELLALIKAGGYELSIQQILEIQKALLTFPVSQMKVDRLKYLLAPIIAKNNEEQRHIHHIIDAYVAEKVKTDPLPEKPFSRWLLENKKLVLALKITGFLVVVAAGILFYILNRENKPVKTTSLKPVTEIKRDSNTTAVAPAQEKKPVDPRLQSTTQEIKPVDIITQLSGRPIIPEIIDFNLQMSLTFGTLLGVIMAWIVFYERKKKMDMKEKQRADDAIFVKRSENKQRAGGSGFEPKGEMAQPTVQFAERDYLVHQPRPLQKIKSYLKRPAIVQNPGLDIKKSITQSIRNAGYTSLAYTSEWKDRKYLFITDNLHADAHMTALLHYILNIVSAAVTAVARYSYTSNAEMAQDETGNWVSFEELAWQYKGYHLIVLGNGYSFINTKNQQLKNGLNAFFQNMSSRSVITPRPLADWNHREQQLENNNFQVVPADIAGIELLTKTIAEDSAVTRNQLLTRITGDYSITNSNFETAAGLRQYLNDELLFQLICALAVYPRLQWALTLALFDALIRNNKTGEPTTEMTYDRLLKIARIPWLYADRFPEKIRLELLNSLSVETEIMARQTVISLLNEARQNTVHDSPAFTELNTQYNINAFFLFSYDQYKYRQYAVAKETIGDYWKDLTEWALKEHVEKGDSALLPRRKSDQSTVEEFLLKEKQFDKWNINFLRAALVTLPAVLLYILFGIIKPAFVYPPQLYKNVSFAAILKKENNCTQNLRYVINSTNGGSDTIILNQLYPIDTISINDVKYNDIISLELWTKDSLMHPVSFRAIDSFFEVRANCR